MRLLNTLIVCCLATLLTLITTAAGALHSSHGRSLAKHGGHKASPVHSSTLSQRQYHARRDLIDICISLDTTVIANLLRLVNPLHADVHLCLCLRDLDIFLDTDVNAKLLIANLPGGKERLAALLKVLLNTSPGAKQCTLPPHARRTCVASDPCGFTCDPNYIKVGNTCVCPSPLSECNGHCGSFPHGCGSAVPRRLNKGRNIGAVTSLAQAQESCNSKETVCGIADREHTLEFECVDISATLDSCGGCITPHPFPESNQSAVRGKECGHLPGVISASCSNSQCIIHQCRDGWSISLNGTECINVSAIPITTRRSKTRRDRQRDALLDANDRTTVVIGSNLLGQIRALGDLIIGLKTICSSVPTPTGSHGLSPAKGVLFVDYIGLVDSIIIATIKTLQSTTVSSLVANIDNLINVATLTNGKLIGCNCADSLGLQPLLDELSRIINAALGIQNWCKNYPVGAPTPRSGSPSGHDITIPSYVPNKSNNAAIIGLHDLFKSLSLDELNTHAAAIGLGPTLNAPVNSVLNGLGIGPANARSLNSGSLPAVAIAHVNTNLIDKIQATVKLVLILKENRPLPPSPGYSPINNPTPGHNSPALPVDGNLLNGIIQVTIDLLNSKSITSLLDKIDALVDKSLLVAKTLEVCGCITNLGLEKLVDDLNNLIKAAVELKRWCSDHPIVPSLPEPEPAEPSTPSNPSHGAGDLSSPGYHPQPSGNRGPNILGYPIDLGLDDLLKALGVELNSTVDTELGLQGLVGSLVNIVIALQGDSTSHLLPTDPEADSPPSMDLPGLVNGLVQATAAVVQSLTEVDLLANVKTLIEKTGTLGDALAKYSTTDCLGLESLVKDVKDITDAALGIKNYCEDHSAGDKGAALPDNKSSHTQGIIIDAKNLLKSLGLGHLLKVDGSIVGLGDGLDKTTNSILKNLGLGGVRRWLSR